MKKITILLLISLIYISPTFAQWTQNGTSISTTNNVGIGTTTPKSKLEIQSFGSFHNKIPSFVVKDITERGTIFLESITNQAADFVFKSNNRFSWLVSSRASAENYSLFLYPSINGTGWGDPAFALNTNGNIGIGTTIPKSKLEIQSSGSIHNKIPSLLVKDITNRGTVFIESVTDQAADLVFKSNNRFSWLFSSRASDHNYSLFIYPSVNGTGFNQPSFVLNANGNMGIGTTSPQAKLDVAGTIRAREVKVEVNAGADHVFNEEYTLKPLAEVENYIKENKHLPEIPSENQMQQDGLNMNEFQIKLLQKIEELTLYTIEQEKENKQLKSRIERLEKLIKQ